MKFPCLVKHADSPTALRTHRAEYSRHSDNIDSGGLLCRAEVDFYQMPTNPWSLFSLLVAPFQLSAFPGPRQLDFLVSELVTWVGFFLRHGRDLGNVPQVRPTFRLLSEWNVLSSEALICSRCNRDDVAVLRNEQKMWP